MLFKILKLFGIALCFNQINTVCGRNSSLIYFSDIKGFFYFAIKDFNITLRGGGEAKLYLELVFVLTVFSKIGHIFWRYSIYDKSNFHPAMMFNHLQFGGCGLL